MCGLSLRARDAVWVCVDLLNELVAIFGLLDMRLARRRWDVLLFYPYFKLTLKAGIKIGVILL